MPRYFAVTGFALGIHFLLQAAPLPKEEVAKPEHFTARRVELLRTSAVQKELGLSAEQRIAVIDHFEAVDDEYSSEIGSLYPPSSPPFESAEETARKRRKAVEYEGKRSAKSQETLARVVTPPQLKRLMELERRYLGPFAFQDREVVASLNLTPAQVAAVAKEVEGFRKRYDETFAPNLKPSSLSLLDATKPTTEAIVKSLEPEQRRRWQGLLGAEPKIATTGTVVARRLIASEAEKVFKSAKAD